MRFTASRRAGLIVAAAGLISGSVLAASAQASTSQPDPSLVATKIAQQLGTRSAGAYIDALSHKLVVTVTSKADAKAVRAAGAVPKTVAFSGAQLQQATSALERTAKVPGTAWGVDPATDQVVLTVDSSVTGAKLVKVTSAAQALGSAVRIDYMPGVFSTKISGGDAIWGGGYRCSLGFNVRQGQHVLLPDRRPLRQRRLDLVRRLRPHQPVLGSTQSSTFPGHDYALVKYTGSASHGGTVGSQDITTRPPTRPSARP